MGRFQSPCPFLSYLLNFYFIWIFVSESQLRPGAWCNDRKVGNYCHENWSVLSPGLFWPQPISPLLASRLKHEKHFYYKQQQCEFTWNKLQSRVHERKKTESTYNLGEDRNFKRPSSLAFSAVEEAHNCGTNHRGTPSLILIHQRYSDGTVDKLDVRKFHH